MIFTEIKKDMGAPDWCETELVQRNSQTRGRDISIATFCTEMAGRETNCDSRGY
jgi:hypothetical protein